MHFKCIQSDLIVAVNTVRRAVAGETPIPVLKGVLITARESSLVLESTDMEIRITHTIPAEVLEEGSALVQAKYFGDLIRFLPDTQLEIKTMENGQSLQMNYGNSVVNFNCFDTQEFPVYSQEEEEPVFSVEPQLLSESIKQVCFAAARDISRPVLTGTLFDLKEPDRLTMVSTDSHRLTMKELPVIPVGESSRVVKAIIPSRALNEVNRVISGDDSDEEVYAGFSSTNVFFKYGSTVIRSLLIDGQFPHYSEVVPKVISTTVEADAVQFNNSLSRAALIAFAEMKGRGNIIRQNITEDTMVMNSRANDVGEVKEEIPIIKTGEDLEIAFNAKYLLDAVKIIDSEKITIEYTGSLSPALIKSDTETTKYLYLILPMRVG